MNNSAKLKQLRALRKKDDKSLQYIIDEAYRILGNPIILYDIDYKILAYTEGAITDDPIWNSHINNGTINNEVADIYINEGFVSAITRADRVVLLTSEKIKYNRLSGKILDKNNSIIAAVSVVASDKPFEDDDIIVTDAICKVLSDEVCKIPYYQHYAQKKNDTYINMLIDGGIKDKIQFSGLLEIIYRGLKSNIYVAVADISQCDPTYTKLYYYRDLFKQMQPAFKYAIYKNYIVFLMSSNNKALNPPKALKGLCDFFEQNNIVVGISTSFENLYEMPRYYAEALEALNERESNSNQHIFLYNGEML